jgi:hypothetical protein
MIPGFPLAGLVNLILLLMLGDNGIRVLPLTSRRNNRISSWSQLNSIIRGFLIYADNGIVAVSSIALNLFSER